MAEAGHNGGEAVAADRLRAFVQRIERLNEEKDALTLDIREVYAEAKGDGFDTKALRKIIAERKQDAADRQEMEAILDLYRGALEGLSDLPLGHAAIARAEASTKSVRHAARGLRAMARKDGGTVSIEVPGQEPVTL